MSECVVRMEMPERCKKCKATLCLWTIDDCEIMDTISAVQDFRKENDDGFPDFCPIICSIPEGHGRLIDGDKLMGEMKNRKWMIGRASDPDCLVFDAPTIVPAERSET